jgi:predicted permease
MSLLSRIANVFRGNRVNREIDEELESHIREAIENGRDPADARRALGSALRCREESRDVKLVVWLDSLRADAVFGWRLLRKNQVTSAAAILSLALAIGACTAAFRLIDALLLRPLPVANAGRLYEVSRSGTMFNGVRRPSTYWAYPAFEQMRAAVWNKAELIAVSRAEPTDLTYRSDVEMEKAYLQYVSGWMFPSFGMRPALGRLFTEDDDRTPGAHPYAVISYGYWSRRFGKNPDVIGRTFHFRERVYEIVGVAPAPFAGTQPGVLVDIFVPSMMNSNVTLPNTMWHRTLAMLKPGAPVEPVRAKLQAVCRFFEENRLRGRGLSEERLEEIVGQRVLVEPAASGASELRSETRRPLEILGVLVALVLLIACANVANLMSAQAAARAREMALRVSLGGGRRRLVQLLLAQSAWLAFPAAAVGGAFAWWSGPFVVGMISPPDNPARLLLPVDWRVLGFGLALAFSVILLLGLAPALRASAVDPVSALKGGEDPRSRRRLMHALIAVQVAFCFLVLFVAGLFGTTFERLAHQPTGFSAERVLVLETVAKRSQPAALWDQMAEHLRGMRGVESVALTNLPLLGTAIWGVSVSFDGAPPHGVEASMIAVSPGWADAMKVPILDGRDLRPGDSGSAIVNRTFARTYFHGESPIGRTLGIGNMRLQVVGLAGDVRNATMRGAIQPQVYVPVFPWGGSRELIVRTANSNPLALAQFLRQEVTRAQPEFRVTRIRTQLEINESQTVRERLLATLALFFAIVALALAGVGLYGVLHYSVLQRRRELCIRIAVGAPAGSIVRLVTAGIAVMLLAGAVAGLALGMASVRFIESLFYQVKATDLPVLVFPALALFAAALLAALPAVIRAVRIDPAATLRAE